MKVELICREPELSILNDFYRSNKAEFLALYGRRRVGKTFLIRTFFDPKKDVIFFNSNGIKDGSMAEQISNFTDEIGNSFLYRGARLEAGKNWKETFKILTDNIIAVPKSKKIILFFDEFPWMATKNSKLLQNLDYFWNHYWSKDKRVKLVICGSSASWIINKVVYNKGGLHNRLTREIALEPFNLYQTKIFLKNMGFKLTDQQITKIYIVMGGIPYYLSHLNKNLSVVENIENLCFKRKGLLVEEFDKLYASLFDDHFTYLEIIGAIADHTYGIGQSELFYKINPSLKGKEGLSKLDDLIKSHFITRFKPMGHNKRGLYYRVIDEYTLFYFSWIETIKESLMLRSLKRGYWSQKQNTAIWYTWAGTVDPIVKIVFCLI
jgi:uncharacterized protein